MPNAAPIPCLTFGCPNQAGFGSRYCDEHRRPTRAHYRVDPDHKKPARSSDYGRDWQRLRKWFLRRNPMCITPHCMNGASQVDHITPHHGRGDALFYDIDNLQALCPSCHSRKTARDRAAGLTR